MHVYIMNWRVVHRWQYLRNTYCLHIITLLVETSVPLVHPFADTSGPQWDVLGPTVHKPCCIAHVHEEMSTVPLLTDRLSAISQVVIRRFSLTKGFTAAIDSWVMTCAWPGRGMSYVLTRPWRKSLHHRKTAVRDIHSVAYTFFIRL